MSVPTDPKALDALRRRLVDEATKDTPAYCSKRWEDLESQLRKDAEDFLVDLFANKSRDEQILEVAELWRQVAVLTVDRAHAVADHQLYLMAMTPDDPAA